MASIGHWIYWITVLLISSMHWPSCWSSEVNDMELEHHLYKQNLQDPNARRWVMAKSDDLQASQQALLACEGGHFSLNKPPAAGLPQSCLTYKQRYGNYVHPLTNAARLNEALPDATHVVLLRVHTHTKWTKDLILNARALAVEANRGGWHFFLYSQGSLARHHEGRHTPVEFSLNVPEDLRPLLQTFDAEQQHAEFPKAHRFRDRAHWGETDFKWREYLGATLFLERFRAYTFAFVVEHDVRYTGKDWGELFNSLVHIGSRALGYQGERDDVSREHNSRPDYIVFNSFINDPTDKKGDQLFDGSSWQYPISVKYFATIYGLSDRMNGHVVQQSRLGNAGFSEQFLPSTALNSDVNAVTISLGEWSGANPIHCCMPQITRIYDSWYESGGSLPAQLMHRIKNKNLTVWTED